MRTHIPTRIPGIVFTGLLAAFTFIPTTALAQDDINEVVLTPIGYTTAKEEPPDHSMNIRLIGVYNLGCAGENNWFVGLCGRGVAALGNVLSDKGPHILKAMSSTGFKVGPFTATTGIGFGV